MVDALWFRAQVLNFEGLVLDFCLDTFSTPSHNYLGINPMLQVWLPSCGALDFGQPEIRIRGTLGDIDPLTKVPF